VAEAFLVAFSLPNMFRRFFAEGAFNMAFVPMFSKKLEANDDANAFARDALTGLGVTVIVFATLATIFMPWLVLVMASGFADDARFDMAVTLGRLVFVYIVFISLAALVSGVLNASGRFRAAAAAPILLNVILISLLILASYGIGPTFVDPEAQGARHGSMMAIGVVLAGIAQLGLVWIAAKRAGFNLVPARPKWTPELKRLAIIAAPAALAGGVVQINLLIGRQVASFYDGAIAWLSYADRLYQLPLGVVGIAIGIVLLPDLSRRLQAGDTEGGRHALSRAAELSLALAIPASVALLVIPVVLVEVLFQRGAFDVDDTAATAVACAVYGLGLPAFVLQKVVQPLFFAREDTKRPFYYAVAAMVVNAGVAVGLSPFIGFIAAAIGATVAGWAMLALLWVGARDMGEAARFDQQARSRIWRICLAAAIMGAGLWFGQFLFSPIIEAENAFKFLGLALLVVFGMVVYAVAGFATRAFTRDEIKTAFKRQR
jgi:putative peptidoglycan lipid II flippase